MSRLRLIWRLLSGRALQNSLAAAVMALCVALAVCVLLLAGGLREGLTQAGKPFPLLLGAKGSPNQLLLNSVFLKDQPVGNISYQQVERLRANKNIVQATPLAFGDSFLGLRIVGTEEEIFRFSGVGAAQPWLQLSEGRAFTTGQEAVLGAEAARLSGLHIGDSFSSIHGVTPTAQSRGHKPYKVVGILKPLDGPYDSAILVPLASIWAAHAGHGGAHKAEQAAAVSAHGAEPEREVTAVVIRPSGYANALQLAASYAKDRDVQLLFPSKAIIQLFSIMGNVERLLQLLSAAVIVLALVIIGSSLYWFVLGSRRQQAVLRALGASQRALAQLYFQLGLTLVTGGLVSGLLLGHGLYALLALAVRQGANLYLPPLLLPVEGVLALAVLACGALCSALPAYLLARRDAAAEL